MVPHFYALGYEWRDAEKSAIWGGVDVASDNRQDSKHARREPFSDRQVDGCTVFGDCAFVP